MKGVVSDGLERKGNVWTTVPCSHGEEQSLWFYLFIFGCVGYSLLRAQAFSSCGQWGLLFVAVRGLLTVVASLVAEHGL